MTNEELYQQYLSGNTEAFEQLYLQMQGFIASVAKNAAQSCGIQKEKGQRKISLAPMVYSRENLRVLRSRRRAFLPEPAFLGAYLNEIRLSRRF